MDSFQYDSLTHLIDRLSLINEIIIISDGEDYSKTKYPKKYRFKIHDETYYLACSKDIAPFLEKDGIKEYLKISSKKLEKRTKNVS